MGERLSRLQRHPAILTRVGQRENLVEQSLQKQPRLLPHRHAGALFEDDELLVRRLDQVEVRLVRLIYRGAIRIAPSRRITSPFSISFSMTC
jgi:hypothetical protein